jgi:uncharacterized membrane protein YeaQ/YmgE (transglycosylase-associated protein family)
MVMPRPAKAAPPRVAAKVNRTVAAATTAIPVDNVRVEVRETATKKFEGERATTDNTDIRDLRGYFLFAVVLRNEAMTFVEFLIMLLIAGVCGALAQTLAGYSHGGCLVAIALGFIGALLGTWLSRVAHLPELFSIQIGDQTFPVIWSIIGGAIFAALLGLFRPRAIAR